MPDEPERQLLERFVQGDQDAFEQLFRRYEHEVYRWAFSIVRERATADDVLVEAFWRAYRGRAAFDASRSFGAWLRRIAANVAKNHLRTARARAHAADAATAPDASSRPNQDLRAGVDQAFRRLSPRLQIVATLALVEEQSYAEIAEALGLPIGTVKSRVFRAIRALRLELARSGIRP